MVLVTSKYVHIFARVLWSDLLPEQTAYINQSNSRVFLVYERSQCATKLANDNPLSRDGDPDCIGFFINQRSPSSE